MKPYIIPALFIAGVVGIWLFTPSTYEVSKQVENVIQEVEVTPSWAEDPEAVEAAKAVIRKKELEAREAELVAEISGKQDELDEIRKELGSY